MYGCCFAWWYEQLFLNTSVHPTCLGTILQSPLCFTSAWQVFQFPFLCLCVCFYGRPCFFLLSSPLHLTWLCTLAYKHTLKTHWHRTRHTLEMRKGLGVMTIMSCSSVFMMRAEKIHLSNILSTSKAHLQNLQHMLINMWNKNDFSF